MKLNVRAVNDVNHAEIYITLNGREYKIKVMEANNQAKTPILQVMNPKMEMVRYYTNAVVLEDVE